MSGDGEGLEKQGPRVSRAPLCIPPQGSWAASLPGLLKALLVEDALQTKVPLESAVGIARRGQRLPGMPHPTAGWDRVNGQSWGESG